MQRARRRHALLVSCAEVNVEPEEGDEPPVEFPPQRSLLLLGVALGTGGVISVGGCYVLVLRYKVNGLAVFLERRDWGLFVGQISRATCRPSWPFSWSNGVLRCLLGTDSQHANVEVVNGDDNHFS